MDQPPPISTPKSPALRWQVSPGALYNMIDRGEYL
jgi:hypothetical protein